MRVERPVVHDTLRCCLFLLKRASQALMSTACRPRADISVCRVFDFRKTFHLKKVLPSSFPRRPGPRSSNLFPNPPSQHIFFTLSQSPSPPTSSPPPSSSPLISGISSSTRHPISGISSDYGVLSPASAPIPAPDVFSTTTSNPVP